MLTMISCRSALLVSFALTVIVGICACSPGDGGTKVPNGANSTDCYDQWKNDPAWNGCANCYTSCGMQPCGCLGSCGGNADMDKCGSGYY